MKKVGRRRIDAFGLWCWRRLLRVPWTDRRSKKSILKEISPEYSLEGLISFRMDWLDLLAIQGTLKSLLQHHSSKGSVLQLSAFLIVHLSHPYMTTRKTIALTRWTFVGKVMSSRFVIAFLNFMATVTICSDFGAPKYKVSHCFHCFPIYFP